MRRHAEATTSLPSLGRNVLGLLAVGLAVSVISAWVTASYFAIDVPASLIWPGDDGYCDSASEGVGVHCFSDLAMYLGLGPSMDPGGLAQSVKFYPPLNRLGFLFFQVLAEVLGHRLATGIYIALAAVCLLVPSLWVSRKKHISERLLVVSLVGIATFPFLAIVDRGNNIAFVVPLLWLLLLALARSKYSLAIVAIVIGSQIKPQIGILALAFLVVRQYRAFVLAVAVSVLVFLLSFSVFWFTPGDLSPLQEFKDYVLFTRFFDQYLPLTSLYPINISFVHLLGLLVEGLGIGTASTDVLQWFVYGVVALCFLIIVWRGRSLGLAVWFPALLMGTLLTPNPVFAYYLVGASVIVALLFSDHLASQLEAIPRGLRWLLLSAVLASLTPLLIPGGWADTPLSTAGFGAVISVLPRMASLLWFLYLVAISFYALPSPAFSEKNRLH